MSAQALCVSYLKEILQGIHLSTDTYKIALYTSSASLDHTTTAYSATNEASGTGYDAGGKELSGFAVGSSGKTAWLDWSNPSWPNSTLTAHYALIYNSSQSDKAVAVIDFGRDEISSNGTFEIRLPTADASSALIRLTGP